MKTVNQLRNLGYIFDHDRDNELTTVRHNDYFFYVNLRFCDEISSIARSIERECFNGVKEMFVAGIYDNDDAFPFLLLNKREEATIQSYHETIMKAEERIELAKNDFNLFLQGII